MNNSRLPRHFPIQVTISSLFIGLIALLGVVLSWQNYHRTSAIILAAADRAYDQITREIQLDFKLTYRPAVQALELIALSPVVTADSLPQRLAALPHLVAGLNASTSITAVQAGFGNGDYFILRSLDSRGLRDRFDAPQSAHYVVDNIGSDEQGKRRLVRIFYDRALTETGRAAPSLTEYDPRTRPWYLQATEQTAATAPYLFYFIRQPGTTVALKSAVPGVVVAIDVTLQQMSDTLTHHLTTPTTKIVLLDSQGNVLAHTGHAALTSTNSDDTLNLARLSELDSGVLSFLERSFHPQPQMLDFSYQGRRWKGSARKLATIGGEDLLVLMIAPLDELLSDAVALRWTSLITTGIIFLIAIPVAWYVSRLISKPIKQLAGTAGQISRFDFKSSSDTQSLITEVDTLSRSMGMMKQTINRFITLINSLAGEKEFDALLTRITRETMETGQADGALIYLVDEDDTYLIPGTLHDARQGECDISGLPRIDLKQRNDITALLYGKQHSVVEIDDHGSSVLQQLLEIFDCRRLTLVAIPLHNRQRETIGVLCLLFKSTGQQLDDVTHQQHIAFIKALSGFAAVTLESRQLLMMQQALLDSFIKLIAGAIDAKSPYTGGHCQRVPELMSMLAQAASNSSDPRFADFQLEDEDWEALRIASWLHDCGKVTTPEYVVDKATKLETLYDRIHEVRMRFEVLKRDASIKYWEQLAAGGKRQKLQQELELEWRQLDQEFAFVASCNQGGEFMTEEQTERLQQIAERVWTRTLDDRLGVSWEELQRRERIPASPLPVQDKLLTDQQHHLIERCSDELLPENNPWGFKLDVPHYKFNRGELYNLQINRGTLTQEERYQINDHIVQTIIMLEKLPYPKHLRSVPLLAGCHHETMVGSGYPRKLIAEQMPLTARMMAIADIFEALTASDRPYKKAKTLSEAVRILSFMRNDGHIDPDLFELFLTSGIFSDYGRRFLQPEQIDEVDISRYLDPAR